MIMQEASYEIIRGFEADALDVLERAGRTCYQSQAGATEGSAGPFVEGLLRRGHESVIEHAAITVRFVCDRGVANELVRHRLASFSQESTRYCRYGEHVTFVIPPWVDLGPGEYPSEVVMDFTEDEAQRRWLFAMAVAEQSYLSMLRHGWRPEQARSVLPMSTKTEIVVTANPREWRHIFKLRCSEAAHPQIRELMVPLCTEMEAMCPEVFGGLMKQAA